MQRLSSALVNICQIPPVNFWKHKPVFLQTLYQSWVHWNIIPVYLFSWNIIYFGQPIKVQIFEIFLVLGSKFVKFLMSILKRQVNSTSNFVSFFIAITHNSPVSFKFILFLLCIKGFNESPNFENFVYSGENLSNSSCHFPNHKSVFLQFLHRILVSWNIAPLYLFSTNIIYFGEKQPIKL